MSSFPNVDFACPFDAHGNDERIVFDEVAVYRLADFVYPYGEKGGVNDEVCAILACRIQCPVFSFDGVVKRLCGQRSMQFAWFAVGACSVIVKYAVGDIAALLDFSQKDTSTDGMYTSGRDIEHITSRDFMSGQHFGDTSISNPFFIFIGRYLLFEAGIQMGTRNSIDDIPHFGFTHFAMFALCHFIIGVYLDAQILVCINELDKQWQFVSILLGDTSAQDLRWILFDDIRECFSFKCTVGDNACA